MPHYGPFRGRITATITSSDSKINASRAVNDRVPATIAQHEPYDERCGTW